MVLHPVDPNERFRLRRQEHRRRIRVRRAFLASVLLVIGGVVALAANSLLGGRTGALVSEHASATGDTAKPPTAAPARTMPKEIRGVHVTMALLSIPGKLDEYLKLKRSGLNTLEVDVKDENGEVGFVPSSVPLARQIGAAKRYYRPREVARRVHAAGIYLIGRVVTFEDPVLAEQRPDMAIHTSDGSVWHTSGGLGWSNPYDRRVWDYDVSLAEAATRAGFDEIQFDYVRFPSDGDLSIIRYPGKHPQPMGWTIPAFVHYAAQRLHPLGARVSVDVFGLSATQDLGIGQNPRRVARYVDAIYPMVYPSHYTSGEYNVADPNAYPGTIVAYSLRDFTRAVRGRRARLVPWLQDFSLGKTYTLSDVQDQIASARRAHTGGFMLWNATGVYTDGALAPASAASP